MYRIFMVALTATVLCVGQACAQDQTMAPSEADSAGNTLLTLEQAVELARKNGPTADIATASVKASQAARTVAGLRPNPSLEIETENVLGSGPYTGFREAETTAGISIPVELGGKRSARMAVANSRHQRVLLSAAMIRADVRHQVTQLYIDAVASRRKAAIAEDQLRIANEMASAASIRVKSGRASPIEEQRAEVGRIQAQTGLEQSRRRADVAYASLLRRLGQSIAAPFGVRLDDAMLDRFSPLQSGYDTAGTLGIAAAKADLAIADAQVRAARSERVPDFAIGTGLRRLEATNSTAAVFRLSVPMPIFNSGRAAVEQATAERERAAAEQRLAQLDAEQEIANAKMDAANYEAAAKAANGPELAAAQEAARIARIGYLEGKFGQLDILDAEKTLADMRLAAVDALAAYQNARALLERLTALAPQ